MKRYFLVVWAAILLCAGSSLSAQNTGVQHLWGKSIGKAQNDRDFLIYGAVCPPSKPALFIVGKAENSSLEIKQNGTAYHYAKDENTDAFLACYSLDGELLWSTYLPALEEGYYNAFATTVEYIEDSIVLVIGNTYQLQDNLENTKALIPKCPGKSFFFEFDTGGQLLRSKTVSFSWRLGSTSGTRLDIPYPPRMAKATKQAQTNDNTDYLFGGIVLSYYFDPPSSASLCFVYSHSFTTGFSWQSNTIQYVFPSIYDVFYSAAYPLTISDFDNIVLQTNPPHPQLALGCRLLTQSEKTKANSLIYSRGVDLLKLFPILENWSINTPAENHEHNNSKALSRYIGDPIETLFYPKDENSSRRIFPGTVQNIHAYNGKYIVQGIHCRNYGNGFFKTGNGENYTYSHDNTHPIPMPARGFYQSRNSSSTAAPYLLIYDSATLFGEQYSEPDLPTTQATKAAYDFEAPLWGSYLDADWLYEDIFHLADSAQWKDLYQPYEPVVCSYNNKFFLIGNAKSIDYGLIGNPVMTEEVFHHQGVVLAFSSSFKGDCPIEKNTAFENVRLLCPGDSVELNVPSEYAGFKFRFDPAFLEGGSIVLNADKSRAWAKKEGTFTAILDGSAIRCPDVSVDTVRIYMHRLPSLQENVFLPRDSVLCAHLDLELDLPDTAADVYRFFWLDKDSIELPYGHDTTRFTVQGMRGLDGFGAGTDTREPRFFQLRLDHKLCGVSFFDTLLIYDQVKPNFELPFHDTLICRNEPVELDSLSPHVYRPFYGFEWNDGKKGSDRSFTDSGTYVLRFFVEKASDFCGYDTASDTIHIIWVDPAMTDIFLPSDTTFCKDLSVTLDVQVPFPSTKYSWQDGPMPDPEEEFEEEQDSVIFTSPVKTIKEEGTYNVLLLDSMGCRNRQEINVTIDDCTPAIEIPNVFTPNGDGVNDVWRFKQLEKCTDVVIEVVDRWGQPVMKQKVASAEDFEWNGRVNNTGARLPDGPYFYMVTYKNLYGKGKVQSGSVTILGTGE